MQQERSREERVRQAAAIEPAVLSLPLTDEQLRQYDADGYLVVSGVVEPQLCDSIAAETWERLDSFFGLKPDAEKPWAKLPMHSCVDLWHVPGLYELRQHPHVYSVFAQLYETHKLCVSIDRVSVKPTKYDENGNVGTNEGLPVHTDWNFWKRSEAYPEIQGGICLADCPVGGGGFFCIPGFHKPEVIADYKRRFESGEFGDNRIPHSMFVSFADKEYARDHVIEVPLKKGDLVVWNSCLPHNGGQNTIPGLWRLQAFVRFLALDGPFVTPEIAKDHRFYRKVAFAAMQSGEKPTHYSTGNAVRGQAKTKDREKEIHAPPVLSPLGRRIWGVDKWPSKPRQTPRDDSAAAAAVAADRADAEQPASQ